MKDSTLAAFNYLITLGLGTMVTIFVVKSDELWKAQISMNNSATEEIILLRKEINELKSPKTYLLPDEAIDGPGREN